MAKKAKASATINHRALVKRMNEVLEEFGLDPEQKIKLKEFTVEGLVDCEAPCRLKLVATPNGYKLKCVCP
jgi:hypothetical protein